jgi:hypothetical protein
VGRHGRRRGRLRSGRGRGDGYHRDHRLTGSNARNHRAWGRCDRHACLGNSLPWKDRRNACLRGRNLRGTSRPADLTQKNADEQDDQARQQEAVTPLRLFIGEQAVIELIQVVHIAPDQDERPGRDVTTAIVAADRVCWSPAWIILLISEGDDTLSCASSMRMMCPRPPSSLNGWVGEALLSRGRDRSVPPTKLLGSSHHW